MINYNDNNIFINNKYINYFILLFVDSTDYYYFYYYYYKDFNLDFKNPKNIISKEIYGEVQYRNFISTYSVDNRINPLEFFLGLFSKKTETKADAVLNEASTIESSLKSTVSLSVLEEKTALYVKV